MTKAQKIEWATKAPDEHLTRMLKSLESTNFFGQNNEGIEIVKAEITKRKNGKED